MAHHKSAKKRIRRNARRYVINHNRISRIRTFVKKVELAVAAGDKDAAIAALKGAEPELSCTATPLRVKYRVWWPLCGRCEG